MKDFILTYQNQLLELNKHLEALKEIVEKSNEELEGNCFYYHQSLVPFPELISKQVNLFWAGKDASKICEIGFNAGHSALLFLLNKKNPFNFVVFDIGEHSYTKPAFNYIKSQFPLGTFQYVEGDSTQTLPFWTGLQKEDLGTFDLVHVDGGHTEACIKSDMKYADMLIKPGGIVVVDDTNVPFISAEADLYIETKGYEEIDVFPTVGYQHRILRKQNKN